MRTSGILLAFLFLISTASALTMITTCGYTASTDGENYTIDTTIFCLPDTFGVKMACNNCVLNFSGTGGLIGMPFLTQPIGVEAPSNYSNITIKGDNTLGTIQTIGFYYNILANNSYNVSIWNMTIASALGSNVHLNGTQGFEIKNSSFTGPEPIYQIEILESKDGIIDNFTADEAQTNIALILGSTSIHLSNFPYTSAPSTTLFVITSSNYTTIDLFTIAPMVVMGGGIYHIQVLSSSWTNITNSTLLGMQAIYIASSDYNFLDKITASSSISGPTIQFDTSNFTTILNSTVSNTNTQTGLSWPLFIASSSNYFIANSTFNAINSPAIWMVGNNITIINSSLNSINGTALTAGYYLAPIIKDLYLFNNTFKSNVSYGILLQYANHSTIANSTIISNTSTALFLYLSNYTTLANNTINSNTSTALHLYNTHNTTITTCNMASNGLAGLIDTSHNVSILDSIFVSFLNRALTINYSNSSTITSSTALAAMLFADGIFIEKGVKTNITNTTATGGAYGIFFSDFREATITNLTAGSTGLAPVAFLGTALFQATITNSTLPSLGTSISLSRSANITFINSSTTGGLTLASTSHNITMMNTTLDRSNIDFGFCLDCNLTVKWYANFTVDDIDGLPIAGANVNATPVFGGQSRFNGTTDAQGDIWDLIEFIEFTAIGPFVYDPFGLPQAFAIFYNNYTFYANKTDYFTNSTNKTINKSTTVSLILMHEPRAPLVNLTQPANATNTTNYSIDFGYTVLELDGDDIVNASIWIWYANSTLLMVQLNTSIILLGPALNDELIDLNSYRNNTLLWNAQACDDTDLCGFNESNRTLILYEPPDYAPAVNLNYPDHNATLNHSLISFNATPFDDFNFTNNATLYMNDSGTWQPVHVSDIGLINATLFNLTYNVSCANCTVIWNVQIYDNASSPHFAFNDTNRTLHVAIPPVVPPTGDEVLVEARMRSDRFPRRTLLHQHMRRLSRMRP